MRFTRKLISHVILMMFFTFTMTSQSSANGVPELFTFHGAGFGHGVGMSQYGARGMALEGNNAIEILEYFYKDVSIDDVRDDKNLRINIGHLLSLLSISTDSPKGRVELYAGDVKDSRKAVPIKVVSPKAILNFTLLGNSAIPSVTGVNGEVEALPSGQSWTVRWTGTRFLTGANTIVNFKRNNSVTKYKYGQLQVKLVKVPVLGHRIEVTNTVRLHDEYLWGLGEMPSSWPFSALQAQVIASRTYALNKSTKIRPACDCHMYNASQDQSFIGYSKEAEGRFGKIWKSAVTSTSVESNTGLAVLYNSAPIGTYFFSSSAGQTETSKNVWGTDLPYIASVPDPWSLDPAINPTYFDWVRTVSQAVLAAAFGLRDVVYIQQSGLHDNSTLLRMTGTSSDGKVATITGEQFRSRTRLPSAWFEIVGPTIIDASPSPSSTLLPSETPTPMLTELPTLTPTSVGVQD